MKMVGSLFDTLDQYSVNFIAETYQNIVTNNTDVFYIFVTIYVGLTFLSMKRGIVSAKDFQYSVFKIVFVMTLVLNWSYFYFYIYDVFTNGSLYICKAITIHGNKLSAASIPDALDGFIKSGLTEGVKIVKWGGWSNLALWIVGLAVIIITLVATVLAVGLIFLSKIASAILLALSPLFIFFLLYDSTKGLFDSYIQHLLGYALIPVMTCAVLMIALSVTSTVMQNSIGSVPSLVTFFPFLISCLVQIWILLQIKTKCASLASGFNLKSFSGSMSETKNTLKNMGNALADFKTRSINASKNFRRQSAGNVWRQL